MKHRKTQLASAVGVALLAGGTAVQAQTPPANLTVQLYGQVNRALMWADNERQSKIFHVDGQPSSTRFGIQGTSQIAPGLRAGARIEAEMKSNPSDVVNFDTPGVASSGQPGTPSTGSTTTGFTTTATTTGTVTGTIQQVLFTERWLDASLEGAWGRINVGQGSGAADDASTIDLSGTAIANGVCLCDWGGRISFTNSATGANVVRVGQVIDNMDFESRYDRAMYTTPVLGGFRAQAGWGQKDGHGEATEASVWFSGKFMGDLQAAIGWSNVKLGGSVSGTTINVQDRETIGGSVSWLHASGFNVTAAYTNRELNDALRDSTHWSGKVGYKFGAHAISFMYSQVDDQNAAGDEAKAYSLGYVWNPIRWAEFYANYILYTLDRTGVSLNDVTVAALGTRLRF